MPDRLFSQLELRNTLQQQEQNILQEINGLGEAQTLNGSLEDLRKYFLEKYYVDMPKIAEEGITTSHSDAQIDVSGRFDYGIRDRSRPYQITGTRITFFVPYSGDGELFKCQASTCSLNPPRAVVERNELKFVYDRTTRDAEGIPKEFQEDLKRLKQSLDWVADDVTKFNSTIRMKIDQAINARREKLLQDRQLVENIGYPLKTREGVSNTYIWPEVRRRITPQLPKVSNEPYSPEPALGMDDYEHILSVISRMTMVMERSPNAFKTLGEEDLRTHFLMQLNGHYEGQATGETFNYEGKTDILVRAKDKNMFIAECKFWNGPKDFKDTIDQLLGYTSWRDTKTALLIFNRTTTMSTVLNRIPEIAKKHSRYKAELDYASETGFQYIFGHRDDPNRELTLTVLVFDVPR